MAKQTRFPVESEAVEERCGPWRVTWRSGEFLIPDIGSFSFGKLVLPLEIVRDVARDSAFLVVKLESGFQFGILHGSHVKELEAFRKRASAQILAAAGSSSYCFDCAREAGWTAQVWSGGDCAGCRGPYCKNPFCLRRLEAEVRDGGTECRSCRESTKIMGRR